MKEKEIRHQSTKPISVVKLIRKNRGGSQSALVQCDDDQHYILKLNRSPQGPNVLANEFLGSRLSRAVGFPVPEAHFLRVTQAFLKQTPSLYFQSKEGNYRPTPGIHLGISLVGDVEGAHRVLDFLGGSDLNHVENRADFIGMYLFDVWAMQRDERQAVFALNPVTKRFRAFFMDHGHLCGGPAWSDNDRQRIACYWDKRVYAGLWNEKAVQHWTSAFQNFLPRELALALEMVPPEWYSGSLSSVCTSLRLRLNNLPGLFQQHSLAEFFATTTRMPGLALGAHIASGRTV